MRRLDLCLSCKACKTECPVQVDMAAYKSEFLAQHYKGRLHPLHHYIFGFADKLARWGSLTPALTNAMLTGPLTSPLIKRIVGVAQERELPRLAPRPYTKSSSSHACQDWTGARSAVAWTASLASAAVARHLEQLLPSADADRRRDRPHRAGFSVQTRKGHICCGRPLYDFGLLDAARTYLANVLDRMAPQIDAGLPFIFLEPSCASVFKDELLELFPTIRARRS